MNERRRQYEALNRRMQPAINSIKKIKLLSFSSHDDEASYFDQFNTTENGLEYDRMKFTPTNVNNRT